jgi:hypothetical protein
MTRDATFDLRAMSREIGSAALLFAGAGLFGFIALVALFKSGLFARSIDILFYRGIVLCGIAALLTVAAIAAIGRRFGVVTFRDALAAGALSLGLNLSFLVVAPVTVDRSLSVFILGYMASEPERVMSVADLKGVFERRYLGDWRQIERRMEEQTVSGNVEARGGGYVLTARGKSFLATSRAVAWMFDTDPRFVTQAPLAQKVSDGGGRDQPLRVSMPPRM